MYRITVGSEALAQIDALTEAALLGFTGSMGRLKLIPWYRSSSSLDNPDDPVRHHVFSREGRGLVTYLILEDQQVVHVLHVQWAA